MALINCPECGKEVSDTSYNCPGCGFQLYIPQRSFTGKIFKSLFLLFNGIMLLTFIGFYFSMSQVSADSGSANVAVGAMGTGMLITIWIFIGMPLGIMSYITRAKAGN